MNKAVFDILLNDELLDSDKCRYLAALFDKSFSRVMSEESAVKLANKIRFSRGPVVIIAGSESIHAFYSNRMSAFSSQGVVEMLSPHKEMMASVRRLLKQKGAYRSRFLSIKVFIYLLQFLVKEN